MSSYDFLAKHNKTGREYEGTALDDYFGRHQYGYQVKDYGKTMRKEVFEERFTIVESDEAVVADVLDIANQITDREFILTDACMWEQNKQQGAFHPHAIEVVDVETGQVRLIESGARIKFVSGKISSGRTQDDYNNQ